MSLRTQRKSRQKKKTRNDNIQAKQKSISRRKESSKLSMLIVSGCKQTQKAEALHSLAQTHTGSKCCFSTGGHWGLGQNRYSSMERRERGKDYSGLRTGWSTEMTWGACLKINSTGLEKGPGFQILHFTQTPK